MRRHNLHDAAVEFDAGDPEGYHAGMARFGAEIGAVMLGGSVYELPPGQSICPYHYEYGNEEWLVVLDGRPTVRHPEGEEELASGDVVCFPIGPAGAHKVTNRTDAPVRVLMLSTKVEPSVAVYPDSDKIGVWPGNPRDNILVRRESNVDYWDREA
ncbi:MAG: cupin domain-containing protein [Solirubrobacteraceae bacterium]